jgi:hypothetical protein
VILFRCFPWDAAVRARARGGALWFPRMLQGDGRHDNPHLYGCLYVSEEPVATVVEQLARFVGTSVAEADLVRPSGALALAAIELTGEDDVIDLDEPHVLVREALRPSQVATHGRPLTQGHAADLFERHARAAGIRWWSTFESLWANVTLFDRADDDLRLEDVHRLELGDDVVREAADFLGLRLDLT